MEAKDAFATKETKESKRTDGEGGRSEIINFDGGIRETSVLVANVQVTNKSLASFNPAAAGPNKAQQEKHYPLNTILLQEDPKSAPLVHKPDPLGPPRTVKPTSTAHLYYCRGNPQSKPKVNARKGSKSVATGQETT